MLVVFSIHGQRHRLSYGDSLRLARQSGFMKRILYLTFFNLIFVIFSASAQSDLTALKKKAADYCEKYQNSLAFSTASPETCRAVQLGRLDIKQKKFLTPELKQELIKACVTGLGYSSQELLGCFYLDYRSVFPEREGHWWTACLASQRCVHSISMSVAEKFAGVCATEYPREMNYYLKLDCLSGAGEVVQEKLQEIYNKHLAVKEKPAFENFQRQYRIRSGIMTLEWLIRGGWWAYDYNYALISIGLFLTVIIYLYFIFGLSRNLGERRPRLFVQLLFVGVHLVAWVLIIFYLKQFFFMF